jgi:hypothetical protein
MRRGREAVKFSGMVISRWRDGKIVEAWNNFDFHLMELQLRLGAAPEAAAKALLLSGRQTSFSQPSWSAKADHPEFARRDPISAPVVTTPAILVGATAMRVHGV